ncbi:receptor activity-modifying protein 2 isoform X2 [Amblyraja radiata]|uniref:receptor activity-modifying protein 2 isoform X2 n=1 Tax=Amblyraja radiata TaxID=386614 RepID=UPI001403DF3D|nr:receptor activity-modifying protein 2 isoform X2 [Amblyraja radiata]
MVFGQYLAACLTLTVASFSTPDSSLGTVAAFTEPNGSNATEMQLNVTIQPVPLLMEDEILHFLELVCGQHFNATMSEIGSDQWCNWTAVASFYNTLTECTEDCLLQLKLFWPNEVGERFFVKKHNDYFQWCHSEPGEWLADPANNMLLGLVLTPICIIPLMVGLVVWCSKTSDTKK